MKVRQRLAKRLDRVTRVTLRNANRLRAMPPCGYRLLQAFPLQRVCVVEDADSSDVWVERAASI